MDTLDAKLIAERARLVAPLSGLANGLGELPPERLAEVLPQFVGLDEIARRARAVGLDASAYGPGAGGPIATGPLGGTSILRE